jgi:hypothetical protein
MALVTPGAVGAQGVLFEPFPSSGYSSNLIYVPSTVPIGVYNNAPSGYDRVNPNIYPIDNGTFGRSTTTIYDRNGTVGGTYRPYSSSGQTVIVTPQYVYPRSSQYICSTSIVGSPIPSPVALGTNGQPCR